MSASRIVTTLVGVFAFSVTSSGCAHSVKIDSSPPGAQIIVDGENKGTAPVILDEEFGFFDEKKVKVELDGYSPLETTIEQSECVWPVIVPSVCGAPFTLGLSCLGLNYATRYAESYEYRLSPLNGDGEIPPPPGEEPEDRDPNASYPF